MMRRAHWLRRSTLPVLAVAALVSPLRAQTPSPTGDPLRQLGLSVSTSGGPRDTLGLLVASVTRDGPADQAGITTGNRILAVNGVATRLGAEEVGRRTAGDSAISRFVRAVRGAPPSGEVTLKVSGGGATRTVALALSGEAIVDPNPAPPPRPVVTPTRDPLPSAASATSPFEKPAQVVLVTPPRPAAPPSVAPPAAASTPTVPTPAPVTVPAPVPVDSTTTRSTPQPVAVAAVVSVTPTAPPTAPATVTDDATLPRIVDLLGQVQLELRRVARTASSLAASDSLADLEWQLAEVRRKLRALSGMTTPTAIDSAATRIDSNSVLARWLRAADRLDARKAAPATPARAGSVALVTPAPALPPASVAAAAAPAIATQAAVQPAPSTTPSAGIELSAVSGDLAAYLGAQAESSLVIVKASDAYEPLKAGDVILQADGVAPNLERLRTTLTTHARLSLTLLRRGRVFTVVVGDATH